MSDELSEYVVTEAFQVEQRKYAIGEILAVGEIKPGVLVGPIRRGWITPLSDIVDEPPPSDPAEGEDLLVSELGLTGAILGKVQAAGLQTRSQLIDYLESNGVEPLDLQANQVTALQQRLEETKPPSDPAEGEDAGDSDPPK